MQVPRYRLRQALALTTHNQPPSPLSKSQATSLSVRHISDTVLRPRLSLQLVQSRLSLPQRLRLLLSLLRPSNTGSVMLRRQALLVIVKCTPTSSEPPALQILSPRPSFVAEVDLTQTRRPPNCSVAPLHPLQTLHLLLSGHSRRLISVRHVVQKSLPLQSRQPLR